MASPVRTQCLYDWDSLDLGRVLVNVDLNLIATTATMPNRKAYTAAAT